METQGMNLFSLLPGMSQVVAENKVLPNTHNAIYSVRKPDFFEMFSQFTKQIQDESAINIDLGLIPPIASNNIANQLPEEITLNFFPVEAAGRPLLPSQLPVQQPILDSESLELKGETVYVQGNNVQYIQSSEKGELKIPTAQSDFKALPVTEIKVHDAAVARSATDSSVSMIPAKTETPEQSRLHEHAHSPKIKHTDLPVIETFIDKPVVQSQIVAQTAASELMSLSKASERKVIPAAAQSAIPVLTGSAESLPSSPVVEPPKPSTAETVLQSAVRQPSAMQPEVPLNRLGQTLIQMISKGEQKLEFRLDPPELGKLTMTVAMERDSVSVQMLTGSQAVRDLLLMQVDRLRTALADESMTLGQISVDVSDQNAQEQKQAFTTETLLLADGGSELGEYQTASVMFKTQGGRLLDYFV